MEPVTHEMDITLPASALSELHPFLRRGFRMEVHLGRSLWDVLTRDCGIDPDYLRNRVQTVFLNGSPVDDFRDPVTSSGQNIALSAAMPGLVGATMRRGGFYAGLRQGISHRQDPEEARAETGWLLLKLYNFPATELCPVILSRGMVLEASECRELISCLNKHWEQGQASIVINGHGMRSLQEATQSIQGNELVRLRVASPVGECVGG